MRGRRLPAGPAPAAWMPQPDAPTETLTDDATSSNVRLIYQTAPLTQPVRVSGTPIVTLNVAFSRSRANLTAALVSYPPAGDGTVLTRGWLDPANRNNDRADIPVPPGRSNRIDFDMQPKDTIVPPGNGLALMVLSSDRDFHDPPPAGTQLTLDLPCSRLRWLRLATLKSGAGRHRALRQRAIRHRAAAPCSCLEILGPLAMCPDSTIWAHLCAPNDLLARVHTRTA
jgi:hypothetical protein